MSKKQCLIKHLSQDDLTKSYDLGYRKGQENMFIAIEKLNEMSKEELKIIKEMI